jgi:DNA-binding transcriptional LysR family regulator
VLADVPAAAIIPESVARELPAGLVAVSLGEPTPRVETALVWREDNQSATCAAFRAVARTVFEPQLLDSSLGEA